MSATKATGGTCGDGIERSYYAINTDNLTSSMVVSKASIAVATTYAASYDCSRNQPITLHTTDSIDKNTDWQNRPGVLDSDYPAVTTHVASGANPNSSCSNHTADFNVTGQAQTIAERSHDVWTVGLFGNESSSDLDDYLRMSKAFVLTVTFDIPPSVPTNLHTVPGASGATADCATSGDGWIGAVTTTGGSSNVKLDSTVSSNVSGETVAADYHVWDRTVLDSGGAALDKSTPSTSLMASGADAAMPIGFVLKDGHEYGWDVYAKDKVGLDIRHQRPLLVPHRLHSAADTDHHAQPLLPHGRHRRREPWSCTRNPRALPTSPSPGQIVPPPTAVALRIPA